MLRWLRRLFTRPRRYWYAVKRTRTQAWLVTPGRAEYSAEFGASMWFDEPGEALLAVMVARSAAIETSPELDHTLVRLAAQPDTNHYEMKEVPW